MGCVPSRPSESFYQEFFGDSTEKNAKEKQTLTKKYIHSKKETSDSKDISAKTEVVSKNDNESRKMTYEEEVARADLRIYEEEMKARKAEDEHRVYLMHCAMNRNGDWVF